MITTLDKLLRQDQEVKKEGQHEAKKGGEQNSLSLLGNPITTDPMSKVTSEATQTPEGSTVSAGTASRKEEQAVAQDLRSRVNVAGKTMINLLKITVESLLATTTDPELRAQLEAILEDIKFEINTSKSQEKTTVSPSAATNDHPSQNAEQFFAQLEEDLAAISYGFERFFEEAGLKIVANFDDGSQEEKNVKEILEDKRQITSVELKESNPAERKTPQQKTNALKNFVDNYKGRLKNIEAKQTKLNSFADVAQEVMVRRKKEVATKIIKAEVIQNAIASLFNLDITPSPTVEKPSEQKLQTPESLQINKY